MSQTALTQPMQAVVTPLVPRILVVEDELGDRLIIMREFKRINRRLTLEFAHNLNEARIAIRKVSFQGVILDNSLPDGKGADFALELANYKATARLPVFMLSGWPSPFMDHKATKANVRAVYSKEEFGARQAHQIFSAV